MELDKLSFVPNAFYDFIVFIGSTVLFIMGVAVGLGVDQQWFRGVDFKAIDVVLLGAAIVLAAYEYGRIAEVWSYIIVQKPLSFFARRTSWFRNPDFLTSLPLHELHLDPPTQSGAKSGNKWTVYFYAGLVNPGLGSDLLKRYAWEKLARNSAFTYAVLWATSVVVGIMGLIVRLPIHRWGFGTAEYSTATMILMAATYYEYYRRNCWNNDLLVKVLPVLMRAEEFIRDEKCIRILLEGKSKAVVRLRDESKPKVHERGTSG